MGRGVRALNRGKRLLADRLSGTRAWTALGTGLALATLVAAWLPAAALDWQPRLAWSQPWRWWTAALVHWSPLHLGANLLGAALVVALGRAAGCDSRLAAAWLVAWPLTQLALLAEPALLRYGGLSGVLHAGVAVAALGLLVRAPGRRRWLGGAIGAGLLAKLLLEQPWGAPLRHVPPWDFPLAPLAHATGALAGLACAAVALALPSAPARR